MKKIILLGATGSIGSSTLKIVQQFPYRYRIVGMSAHQNWQKLCQLGEQFHTNKLVLTDTSIQPTQEMIDAEVTQGEDALVRMIQETDADLVVHGIVGSAGMVPSVAALEAGKSVALANKETLVMGGSLVMNLAKQKGVSIIPVDSEHAALMALLQQHTTKNSLEISLDRVSGLILTASGGPFFGKTSSDLLRVTQQEALNHPTWKMGKKISIDSATLANKGLEIIEAHHLFRAPYEKIEVVVHPQSTVHGMIRCTDGSIHMHMGYNDMRYPIHQALCYPKIPQDTFHPPFILGREFDKQEARHKSAQPVTGDLNFFHPDTKTFQHLSLAYDAGTEGGTASIAYNRGNEEGVYAFLAGKIGFTDIYRVTAETVAKMAGKLYPAEPLSVAEIQERDTQAAEIATTEIERLL